MMPLIIEKLYAWVSEDDAGQQGIVGFLDPPMPMIGADMARIESLRPYAEKVAKQTKKKILLMEFSNMKVLEVVGEKSELES